MRREEQDPPPKDSSAQPSMAESVKSLANRPTIIPCPALNLMHHYERPSCRMPCEALAGVHATLVKADS